ncbi:Anti-anti-sigma regulatory factor (antagonist of anti-sigma factor) [Desulfofundulus australicus DSM 11792]|uniref:Anti-anti-sigma regulatory factor (Antagonist of anti-sigma factor) n=1 Tax=Desulfofundulus australicus DSM 11792 TaxID=1121425 RepID=A0A1M5D619_9FIRM|nr:STAS domain-containing protein [Desulfofundulus australicus]SHF62297.1 Anti-anti-sigma regulatory factor (antagonist of anti-sigma factor) [Desulfofundulus australicus DSM 11792]
MLVKIWRDGNSLRVSGIVVNHHFKKLQRVLEDMAREEGHIVLDLRELEFIDEPGVCQLFSFIDQLSQRGIRVEPINAQDKVLTKFLVVGLRLWLDEQIFTKVG